MKMDIFGFNRALTFEYQYEPDVKMLVYFRNPATQHLGVILINGSTIDDIINAENIIANVKKEFKDSRNHLEFFRALYARLSEMYVLQHIQLKSFTESRKGLKNKAMQEIKQKEFDVLKKVNKTNTKRNKNVDIFPTTEKRLSDYIKLNIDPINREVVAEIDGNEKATLVYRKSWSYRKYIDTIFNKTNIIPSWDFRYGWEYVS